jgi:Flp pilus assembly protein TadG
MNLSKTFRKTRLLGSGGAFARRFATACEGIMAVEFALIAPIMITMYFGVTELSDGYTANTKVTAVASTAADLAAQESAICNVEMNDIFTALNAIMFPFPINNMQIKISSLIDAGNNSVRVAWSDARNTLPRTVNSVVPIPAGLVPNGSGGSVILAEVTYEYSSPAGHLIYGAVPFNDQFYLHPRRAVQIARSANGC